VIAQAGGRAGGRAGGCAKMRPGERTSAKQTAGRNDPSGSQIGFLVSLSCSALSRRLASRGRPAQSPPRRQTCCIRRARWAMRPKVSFFFLLPSRSSRFFFFFFSTPPPSLIIAGPLANFINTQCRRFSTRAPTHPSLPRPGTPRSTSRSPPPRRPWSESSRQRSPGARTRAKRSPGRPCGARPLS